jgi:hypothetical protein
MKQVKPSFFQEVSSKYKAEQKKLNRKKFLLKTKLTLTIILPVFIVVLAVKVIQTFLQIKMREIFTDHKVKPVEELQTKEAGKPIPAVMTPVEKEIIKPTPYTN